MVSVVSLLANVFLIGGSRQLSKDFLLVWIIWKSIAILIFWAWYGYNQLKHYGYIDWTSYGMKNCAFCDLNPESTYVGKFFKFKFLKMSVQSIIAYFTYIGVLKRINKAHFM